MIVPEKENESEGLLEDRHQLPMFHRSDASLSGGSVQVYWILA